MSHFSLQRPRLTSKSLDNINDFSSTGKGLEFGQYHFSDNLVPSKPEYLGIKTTSEKRDYNRVCRAFCFSTNIKLTFRPQNKFNF